MSISVTIVKDLVVVIWGNTKPCFVFGLDSGGPVFGRILRIGLNNVHIVVRTISGEIKKVRYIFPGLLRLLFTSCM